MKITVNKKIEVEITALKVFAGVRYWEDATVGGVEDTEGDLIPCRNGDMWCPIIDVDNGRIINWIGQDAEIHYKVCDAGTYQLVDKDGNIHLEIDNYYVPSCMCPGGDGYGDYIIMNVDDLGNIENWDTDFEDFFTEND